MTLNKNGYRFLISALAGLMMKYVADPNVSNALRIPFIYLIFYCCIQLSLLDLPPYREEEQNQPYKEEQNNGPTFS